MVKAFESMPRYSGAERGRQPGPAERFQEVPLIRIPAMFLASLIALSGCSPSGWVTDYDDIVTRAQSDEWGPATVKVSVPSTLSVSEANSYAPNADIVWQEDPPGDRRAQVAGIMKAGADRATRKLRGGRPVTLAITVTEFHALTRRARYHAPGGVHNITFVAQVFDGLTGQALTPPDEIRADLMAFTGAEAVAAEMRGFTQKRRITDHVDKVLSGWLAIGEDPRGSFGGLGR